MSAASYVPITPAVLEWAMDQAALDPAEVAERAKVDADQVLSWLAGEEQPTKTQFRKVVSLLRRPPTFFFLPEPPSEDPVPTSFRHPSGGARDATRAELEVIRRARRVQKVALWTAEKVGDRRWASNPAPSANGSQPNAAAAAATTWLDWSTDEQREAPSAAAVVRLLRSKLEDRGVLSLQLSMGADGCRGFSFYDAVKPLIAVNTHYNAEARLYSYLHELGHLMRRTDAMCVGYGATSAERWCERFAAAMLLPADALRARVDHRVGKDETVTELDQVRLLARDFNVSISAMAIRLEGLRWGDQGLFDAVPRSTDFKAQGGGRNADNSRGAARLRELGQGYFGLLLAAERDGALRRQDVLRYLDVNEGHLRELSSGTVEPLQT